MTDFTHTERISRRQAAERLTDVAYALVVRSPVALQIDGQRVVVPIALQSPEPHDSAATRRSRGVPEFAIAYYGILRAGGVVAPMNVMLKQREIAFYLSDPSARLFFAWHECADAARAAAQQTAAECIVVEPGALDPSRPADPPDVMAPKEGDDTAVILYTSSTTGTPKGAELTHANLARLPGSIGTPVAGVEMRIVDDERRELAPGEALDLANSAAVVAMPMTPDRFRTTKRRSNP